MNFFTDTFKGLPEQQPHVIEYRKKDDPLVMYFSGYKPEGGPAFTDRSLYAKTFITQMHADNVLASDERLKGGKSVPVPKTEMT